MDIDCRFLCRANSPEIVKLLRQESINHGAAAVTNFLFDKLEADAIPYTVVATWLSCLTDPSLVVRALYSSSRYVRQAAIKTLRRWCRGPRWRDVWQALGGVEGVADVFSRSSYEDVEALVDAFCNSVPARKDAEPGRRAMLTELTKRLLPHYFSEADFPIRDERNLQPLYFRLLPACEWDAVCKVLGSGPTAYQSFDGHRIAIHHFDALAVLVISGIEHHIDDNLHNSARELSKFLLEDHPSTASDTGTNRTIDFGLNLLSALVTQDIQFSIYDDDGFVTRLVEPLLRQLSKHHSRRIDVLSVTRLTIQYAKAHDGIAPRLLRSQDNYGWRAWIYDKKTSHKSDWDFVSLLVYAWTRDVKAFEPVLVSTLQLLGRSRPLRDADLIFLLPIAHRPLRFELLRLIYLHGMEHKTDVFNTDDVASLVKRQSFWDPDLFTLLDSASGLMFLDRLLEASKGSLRIKHVSSSELAALSFDDLKPDILRLKLQGTGSEILASAKSSFEKEKGLAARAPDPGDRYLHALAAMLYSVASGSIVLYTQCVQWSQRFFRDPKVGARLLGAASSAAMESIQIRQLLGGVSPCQSETLIALEQSLKDADHALTLWTRVLSELSRESHAIDLDHATRSLTGLLDSVLLTRVLAATDLLQRIPELDEDTLYDLLYARTMSTFLAIEEDGLSPGASSSDRFIGGMTAGGDWDVKGLHPCAWRFLDEYAKARNDLWSRTRLREEPGVDQLASIWPKGLPIQYLLPFMPGEGNVGRDTSRNESRPRLPYLETRAESIVLIGGDDANATLPGYETQRLVGASSDSYPFALRLYVHSAPGSEGKRERGERAWRHATLNLSRGLNSGELWSRWVGVFHEVLGDEFIRQKLVSFHGGPFHGRQIRLEDHEDGDLMEWLPKLESPRQSDDQKAHQANIEVLLQFHNQHNGGQSKWFSCPEIDGYIFPPNPAPGNVPHGQNETKRDVFASSYHHIMFSRSNANIEALTAIAVLWLDLEKGGSSSVLLKGFPEQSAGKERSRIPPLLLDPTFVVDTTEAIKFLERYNGYMPVNLMVSLAEGALTSLKSRAHKARDARRIESVLFRVLNLLAGEPAAVKVTIEAVTSLPKSSSWHRHVMNKKLISRLAPEQAQLLLRGLMERITEIQHRRKQPKTDGPKPPPIKISSVKMIPELLNSTAMFNLSTAVSFLADLMKHHRHPDILCQGLRSLFRIIDLAPEQLFGERMCKTIEGILASFRPVVGALDERAAHNDIWQNWTPDKALPTISLNNNQPITDMLFERASSAYRPSRKRFDEFIGKEVLVPAVEQNKKNTQLWLARFCQKHEMNGELPASLVLPMNRTLLESMLTELPQFASKELLSIWQTWFIGLHTADEKQVPKLVLQIIEAQSGPLRRVDRWLWFPGSDDLLLSKLLDAAWDWELETDSIHLLDVQDSYADFAEALLELSDYRESFWRNLQLALSRPREFRGAHSEQSWVSGYAPILHRLVKMIDDRRTLNWQASPNRHPKRLPDTFEFKVILWPWPWSYDTDADLKPLLKELTNALCDLAENRIEFRSELHSITDIFRFLGPDQYNQTAGPMSSQQIFEMAEIVGNLVLSPSVDRKQAMIRVCMAEMLLDVVQLYVAGQSDVKGRSRALMEQWLASEVEEIRDIAWSVKPRLD